MFISRVFSFFWWLSDFQWLMLIVVELRVVASSIVWEGFDIFGDTWQLTRQSVYEGSDDRVWSRLDHCYAILTDFPPTASLIPFYLNSIAIKHEATTILLRLQIFNNIRTPLRRLYWHSHHSLCHTLSAPNHGDTTVKSRINTLRIKHDLFTLYSDCGCARTDRRFSCQQHASPNKSHGYVPFWI